MRNRHGFVSNSSSSSFVIAIDGDISDDFLEDIFKTENKILKKISSEIVKVVRDKAEKTTPKDIMSDHCAKTIEDLPEMYQDVVKIANEKGFQIYTGYFEDGGYGVDGIEAYLCHTEIRHIDDKLVFMKDSGY